MPADITGTEIIQDDPVKGTRALKFMPGPVFTNLLLADEINRTPPKTQAAMLQTMQEREVTAGRDTMPLPKPFHVFATQNPIEMEGTYQLPEAATDRFMLSVMIHYPEPSQEVDMVRRTTGTVRPALEKVMNADDLLAIQQLVRAVPVSDEVIRFAVDLVGSTRPDAAGATEQVKRFVRWGAGPRASQYLILGAKGRAAMIGKPCADVEDVRSVALLVLRHRILTNFKARSEGMDADRLLDGLVKAATI
jgi:MoxR-like ATPase